MQGEISQSPKYRHCVTPPTRGIYKIVQFRELPSGTVDARCWGRGRAELLISTRKQYDVAPERVWATRHLVNSTQYLHYALNLRGGGGGGGVGLT